MLRGPRRVAALVALQCLRRLQTEHWFGWAPLLIFNVEYLDSSLSPQGAEHVDVSIINDKCSSVCNFISGCLDKCGVEPQGAYLLRLPSTAGVYK